MTERHWVGYISRFHRAHAGITEVVLGRSTLGGVTPYQWLAAAIPRSAGPCLDLACGSGPLRPIHPGGWIGVDRAPDELALAHARAVTARVVLADAARLPFGDEVFDTAVCAMGLMVISAVGASLAELARVVRPHSTVAFLLPASRPLTGRDRMRYARLLVALRRAGVAYPRRDVVAHPGPFAHAAGFSVVADERERFRYPMPDPAAADALVSSLYLPDTPTARIDAAHRVARRWAGSEIGIPLRRIVATRGP